MQTPLHLMKISHLSGQALGIINLQRGPAKPQVFTPTPVDHLWWGAASVHRALQQRQKKVKGEQEWQTWGNRHSQSCSCCLPSSCSTLPEDARGCAWPSRPIPAPASPDCRADGQQMPGSSTEEELGGMQGFGHHCKTHVHSWLPESQLYNTPKFWLL